MAAVDPSLKRSADVRALDTVVALKINSATFGEIGRKYPPIWQPVARELSRRLNERNSLIPPPNDAPKLFIISSKEALEVAREVQSALSRDAMGTVWTDGVFFAGGYPLESLEKPSTLLILPWRSRRPMTSSDRGGLQIPRCEITWCSSSAYSWANYHGIEQ